QIIMAIRKITLMQVKSLDAVVNKGVICRCRINRTHPHLIYGSPLVWVNIIAQPRPACCSHHSCLDRLWSFLKPRCPVHHKGGLTGNDRSSKAGSLYRLTVKPGLANAVSSNNILS